MHGRIARKLRVKRRSHDVPLLHEHRFAGELGEDFQARANAIDDRRANKNHFQGCVRQHAGTKKDVAGEMPAIGVAQNGHVQKSQRGLCRIFHFGGEQNRSRTGSKDGAPFRRKLLHRVKQALFLQELELRSALPSRQNQPVAPVEILTLAS